MKDYDYCLIINQPDGDITWWALLSPAREISDTVCGSILLSSTNQTGKYTYQKIADSKHTSVSRGLSEVRQKWHLIIEHEKRSMDLAFLQYEKQKRALNAVVNFSIEAEKETKEEGTGTRCRDRHRAALRPEQTVNI